MRKLFSNVLYDHFINTSKIILRYRYGKASSAGLPMHFWSPCAEITHPVRATKPVAPLDPVGVAARVIVQFCVAPEAARRIATRVGSRRMNCDPRRGMFALVCAGGSSSTDSENGQWLSHSRCCMGSRQSTRAPTARGTLIRLSWCGAVNKIF